MPFDFHSWMEGLGNGHLDPNFIDPKPFLQKEVVVDTKTGLARQAGASQADAAWIVKTRQAAEQSLFILCRGILGMSRLTKSLHLEVCNWLQKVPPYRKLYLLPRDHLKTSIARGLITHLLIQPQENNVYFPGCVEVSCSGQLDCTKPQHRFWGRDTRVLYAGETDLNAVKQLSWALGTWQGNKLLRALWPNVFWENPRKESEKWSSQALLLQRGPIYPEASLEGIGVGGAVTGRHYNVLIKDDIATLKAANSRTVMEDTIEWNRLTRALMDDPDKSLEFMLGTRWAPRDIWETIQDEDPSVDVMVRAIVEDGKPIFPEMFSLDSIARLKREEGAKFPFIRMNTGCDPSVVDFLPDELREFTLSNGVLLFDEDQRDSRLQAIVGAVPLNLPKGTKLTPKLLEEVARSGQRLRIG